MNFPPLNVNNLVMRHVNLPGLGPVFLVDNFGLVSAPNEYMVVNMIAGSISVQNRTPELSRVVATLIHSGMPALLGATNHAAYAIYKVGERYGILHIGTDNLYHVRDEEKLKEVLQDFQSKFKLCTTHVAGFGALGEPLYVGFTALSQQTQNGYWGGNVGMVNGYQPSSMLGDSLPIQLVTTRIPAKPNSQAVWGVDNVASAMEDAFGENEKSESNVKFLTDLLRSIEGRKPTAEEIKELTALLSSWSSPRVETKPIDDVSKNDQLIGRIQRHLRPIYALYQFPLIGWSNPNNARLSEALKQVLEQRRAEKETVLLNTTHFSITDVNDKVFVITDKTFGGSLTLHITDASQKESLLRRLNGLKELILEGRNTLYYTDTILSAGENDFWKLTNTVISGSVKLVGKTVLANTELRAGSYVDAMIENVK